MNRLICLLIAFHVSLSAVGKADFIKTGELTTPQFGLWISRVDGGWFTSHFSYINRTDENFVSQDTIGPVAHVRGLDWDPTRNLLFASSFVDDAIWYHTPDGAYAGQFPSLGSANDVAVNPSTGDIWLLFHSKRVQRVSFTGEVLSTFDTPFYISGLTVDPVAETLLIMRSADPFLANDPFDDEIYEFDYTGNNLGLQVPAGSFGAAVGQGLEYDPSTKVLYASGASEQILMFQRVPEPPAASLMVGALMLGFRRLRRPQG